MPSSTVSLPARNQQDSEIYISGLDHPIDLDSFGLPKMPTALEGYQRVLSDSDIEAIASVAYDAWEKNTAKVIKERIYRFSACHNSGVEFGVDPVVQSDYQIVEHDLSDPEYFEYAYDERIVDIKMAVAKRICASCPVIGMCLAASMTEMRNGRMIPEESGIWGGVGPVGRQAILPIFEAKLDEYDAALAAEEKAERLSA